jgi:FMN phosphatase YigB (HAD superfamily)
MVASKVVTLDRFESTERFAEQLNTENEDHTTWQFVERLRSESFFGQSLSLSDAERMEREICKGVFAKAKVLSDAHPALCELKQRGLKTGIVSNLPWGTSSAIWADEFTRHGFGADVIDRVVCCVDAGFRKPHPAAIIECLGRLECEPAKSIYVGDRPSDIYAGKSAGCRTVLVNRREDSYTDKADVIIHDLRDLVSYL